MSNQQQALEFKNKGNQAFKAKKYEEAIEHFTKAIELNPNDHVYYSNRSGSYLNSGKYDQALQDAEKCIEMKSDWPRGYQRKGTALYYLDQLEEALNTYQEGLKFDPNNAELQKNVKQVEAKKGKGAPGGAPGAGGQDMNAMMQAYMKLMNHPETKDFMSDPEFMPLLMKIMGNPQEMMKHMGDPRIQKVLKVLQEVTPADQAQKAAEAFMKNQGGNMPQSQNAADFQEMKPQQPQQSYSPPPPQKKEQPKPQKMDIENPAEQAKAKGNDQFKKKNFDEALNYYEQAISINPNEPLYYNNKAAAYIELGDFENAMNEILKAEKLFEEGVVKDFVKKAKVLGRKGNIFMKQQKYSEAIAEYERSLIEDTNQKVKDQLNKCKKIKKEREAKDYINPALAQTHNEAGAELYKQGKFPDALKEYEEAIRRNPEIAKYYSNVGQVYIKLMEFQRAKQSYETALKKDPEFQKAYHKKGDCHFFLKEFHKAMETYDMGLKKDPNDKFCQEGIQKTQASIYMGSNNQEDQEERAKRAMSDPEIQAILQTPEVRNALADLQRDPKSLAKIMSNKSLATKIEKLIAAGILKMG